MAKNNRYKAIFDQADQAETVEEQVNCILTAVKVIAVNHLPCIEKKVGKIYWAMLAIVLMIFLGEQISMTSVILLFMRIFG